MYYKLHYSLPKEYVFPQSIRIWYPEENIIQLIGSALLKSFSVDRIYECYWYITNIDDRSFDLNFRIPDDLDLDYDFKFEIVNTIERVNQHSDLKFELDDDLLGFEIIPTTDLEFLNELFNNKFDLINGDCIDPD